MAFRFAYSSLRWQSPDLEQKLARLKEAGWDGWEVRQSLDWLGSPQRVRALGDAVGVEPAAVCGAGISLEPSDPAIESNKRRIEFASDLGVATYMAKGPGRGDGPPSDDDLKQMAAVYELLADYAAPLGVTVTFHPHQRHKVDSADEFERFMARLDRCRLCLDMSHLVHWGLDPVRAVADYRDRIAYVHLHDHTGGRSDNPSVELGEAQMCDFPAFLQALEEIGYGRWITACPGESERTDEEKMRVNREYLNSIGY